MTQHHIWYHVNMQITVMQWNVWYRQNIEHVLAVLQEHNADVICLQELTRGYLEQSQENTWEYLAHELGYFFQVQEIPIITPDAQWSQANAIFSRYPITSTVPHWIHEPAEADDPDDQYRGYLEVAININGTDCTVATSHMSFSENHGDDPELQNLLSILRQKHKRFVFTGDLNAVPGTQRVTEIAKLLQHAGPAYDQGTWTTKPYTYNGVDISTLDWRYDYIFTTPDIKATDARILTTEVSDHLPVLATLELA